VGNLNSLVNAFPEEFTSESGISKSDRFIQRVRIEDPNNPDAMIDVWQRVDSNTAKKALDDKAYIDMPNLEFNTFANPRAVKFGIKIVF